MYENMLDILMDLPKAFETINNDLLIVRLVAYGFSWDALQYMKSYLTERQKKRVLVNSSFNKFNYVSCLNYIKLIKLIMNLS